MHLEVIVIRQDGSVPVKYGLTMEMESRHAAIKPLLARDAIQSCREILLGIDVRIHNSVVQRYFGTVRGSKNFHIDTVKFHDTSELQLRLCAIPPSNLIVVDIVKSHLRPLAPEEQKVKSLNGSCIFAYEFHSQPLNNNNLRGSAGSNQSFSDIQRNSRLGAASSTSSRSSFCHFY